MLAWSAFRLRRRLVGKRGENLYSGAFSSFAEAQAAIPKAGLVGYDNRALAGWYRERLDRVQPEDYPVLFWLQRLLPQLEVVFDLGGHVGLHFYAWRRLLALPSSMGWVVCEVPAVVEAGQGLARERKVDDRLSFTTDVTRANGATVFLASGSVQYLEPGALFRSLASLQKRPRHLLLNKLPVHELRDYVTVQDTGASFHPYTVMSKATLENGLAGLGYRRVDAWVTPGLGCRVVLAPKLDVPAYSGGYWVLESSPS